MRTLTEEEAYCLGLCSRPIAPCHGSGVGASYIPEWWSKNYPSLLQRRYVTTQMVTCECHGIVRNVASATSLGLEALRYYELAKAHGCLKQDNNV